MSRVSFAKMAEIAGRAQYEVERVQDEARHWREALETIASMTSSRLPTETPAVAHWKAFRAARDIARNALARKR